jgi:hypothetical protein
VRAQFDDAPVFSQAQRDKIKEIWQAADLQERRRRIRSAVCAARRR